ncbi:hypothetical protein ASG91_11430 [Phycicoccus sp. Soil802]|nr:hypothetical protein ASG91_11430 [Phycicoccus sp. Soil802]
MCIRVPEDQGFINVTVVDCRAEHQAEVMGRAALSGPKKWPGDEAMDTMALQKCREAFEPYIGLSFDESALDMDYFTADREGWQVGDRTVVCLVFDPNDDGASNRALRGVRE